MRDLRDKAGRAREHRVIKEILREWGAESTVQWPRWTGEEEKEKGGLSGVVSFLRRKLGYRGHE